MKNRLERNLLGAGHILYVQTQYTFKGVGKISSAMCHPSSDYDLCCLMGFHNVWTDNLLCSPKDVLWIHEIFVRCEY